METLTHIFFIALAIFSLVYCAMCRINELKEERMPAGPIEEPARPQKISNYQLFKQWAINLF
jgi:hypothetical protein